jgi:hypothetical protein
MRRPPICYARFFARVKRNPRKPGIQHYRQTSGIRGVGSHGDEEEGPSGIVQARLRVRSGSSRRKRDLERPSRRQRGEPGRDGTAGAARAARVHHHDRGLHPLLRQQEELSQGFARRGRSPPEGHREEGRAHLQGPEEPADGVRPIGRSGVHAGHDGHDPEPRPERQNGRRFGASLEEPAFRPGLLPPVRGDVRGRRPRAETA